MAPTPLQSQAAIPHSIPEETHSGRIPTSTLVAIVAIAIFGLCISLSLAHCIYRRCVDRKKIPPEKRSMSYRPYRRESSKTSLLANAGPTPDTDKSSMFSREASHSSVSLIVDSYTEPRHSIERAALIPLHVTSAYEDRELMTPDISLGSGFTGRSMYSRATSGGSLGLSQIPIPGSEDNLDVSRTRMRPRSTSTSSMRYYEANTAPPTPTLPKFVHIPSHPPTPTLPQFVQIHYV
jgi:hypothetical protein